MSRRNSPPSHPTTLPTGITKQDKPSHKAARRTGGSTRHPILMAHNDTETQHQSPHLTIAHSTPHHLHNLRRHKDRATNPSHATATSRSVDDTLAHPPKDNGRHHLLPTHRHRTGQSTPPDAPIVDYIHELPQLYPYDSESEHDSATCIDSDLYTLYSDAEDEPPNTIIDTGKNITSPCNNDNQQPNTPNPILAPLDIEGLAHVSDRCQQGLHKNSYVGDVMCLPKDVRMTRIYFQNVNGITLTGPSTWSEICAHVRDMEVDITLLAEHKLDTKQPKVMNKLYEEARKTFGLSSFSINAASTEIKSPTMYKPGGVLSLVTSSVKGRTLTSELDQHGRLLINHISSKWRTTDHYYRYIPSCCSRSTTSGPHHLCHPTVRRLHKGGTTQSHPSVETSCG